MKKLVYLLFIIATLGAIGCEKKLTAAEYNNKIINEQSKVFDLVLEFTAKVDSSDMKGARALLDITGVQCDSSIKIIEAMGPFEEDASFKDAAIDLFKFYKRAFAQDYKELLDIIEKEEPTLDDLDRVNVIVKKVGDEEKVVDDKIQTVQKAFADKHDVKIPDNDTDTNTPNKNCVGNQDCISQVRLLVTGAGYKIVGEEYAGKGVFSISAFKYGSAEPINITYLMDCNCTPIDMKVLNKARAKISSNKIHRCGRIWQGKLYEKGIYGDYCCMACYIDYYPN